MVWSASDTMDDVFILNQNDTDAARLTLIRLHEAVRTREPDRPEAALSPQELLAQFRTADPTRNGSCLTWLLRTYASGGYRLEDLSKAHDTLTAFARFRGYLPDTAIVPEPLRTEAMCLTAVKQGGETLYYVPQHLRTEAICIVAVGSNGLALAYVPEHLRTETICTVAVTHYGQALEYVPEYLCTEAICLAAVGEYGPALAYVPNHLRTEAIQLVAKAYNECKTVLINSEIHAIKSHDLVLVGLENYLNK